MVRFELPNNELGENLLEVSVEVSDEEAILKVEERNQCEWVIVSLNRAGRLVRSTGIPKGIGLDVDDKGRVKWEDE